MVIIGVTTGNVSYLSSITFITIITYLTLHLAAPLLPFKTTAAFYSTFKAPPLKASPGQVDRGRPHVVSICANILGCTLLSDPKHCVILSMGCHTCVKASCSLLGPNCSPELAHTHAVTPLAAAQHLQTNAPNNLRH